MATGVLLALVAAVVGLAHLARAARQREGREQLLAAPAGPAAAAESADLAAVRAALRGRPADAAQCPLSAARQARHHGAGSGSTEQLSGRYLYELPWYVIIGAPGSGKTTALRNAGLQFPLAAQMGEQAVRGVGGTRNCDWWFTDQAVLIDTAGRFTTQDSDQATDRGTWSGFLDTAEEVAPAPARSTACSSPSRCPTCSRKGSAERARHAQTVRQRVQELHEQLGVRFPIYLLVTKCDLMAGFMRHLRRARQGTARHALGLHASRSKSARRWTSRSSAPSSTPCCSA